MLEQTFDIFLAHSSKDKPLIRKLYKKLVEWGVKPWLDEEEIAPGDLFLDKIQEAIRKSKVAAICIGAEGFGEWQAFEARTLVSLCIQQGVKVIPVLLPQVMTIPDESLFLQQFQFVQFQNDLEEKQIFERLVWGITGVRPESTPNDFELSNDEAPVILSKLIRECNPEKILFVKNVKDPSGRWAYPLNGVLPSKIPTFELMWRLSSHGAGLPKPGDLMLLHQQAKVTHLVEFLDDQTRKTDWGYLRWVKVIWMPGQKDWYSLPHQEKVLGFNPKYRDGNTHSFTSPNFTRFKQAWGNRLKDFQHNLVEHLLEIS